MLKQILDDFTVEEENRLELMSKKSTFQFKSRTNSLSIFIFIFFEIKSLGGVVDKGIIKYLFLFNLNLLFITCGDGLQLSLGQK